MRVWKERRSMVLSRWGVCSLSTLQALNVRYIVHDHSNRVVPCTNGSAPVRSLSSCSLTLRTACKCITSLTNHVRTNRRAALRKADDKIAFRTGRPFTLARVAFGQYLAPDTQMHR